MALFSYLYNTYSTVYLTFFVSSRCIEKILFYFVLQFAQLFLVFK